MIQRFFFNRRSGSDRRKGCDQRRNPRLDLSYRRRRKSDERRDVGRNSAEDFYAKSPNLPIDPDASNPKH